MASVRIIKVTNCAVCPLTRKRTAREKRYCTHPDTDGMEIEYWDVEVNPDCPLPTMEVK